MSFLNVYYPDGSCPAYVTKPIARKGIFAMAYETYKKDHMKRNTPTHVSLSTSG